MLRVLKETPPMKTRIVPVMKRCAMTLRSKEYEVFEDEERTIVESEA